MKKTETPDNIKCAFSKMVKIDKLIPHPRNPNTHPNKQIELLSKVLSEKGWRSPIVVSNQTGFVIQGHGRLHAARIAGFKEVPVEYQDYESDADELSQLIGDNKITELSELDNDLVAPLIREIEEAGLDSSLTGFNIDQFTEDEVDDDSSTSEPTYDLATKLEDQLDYIVILCDNTTDFIHICELAEIKTEQSYKSTGKGRGRVIKYDRIKGKAL